MANRRSMSDAFDTSKMAFIRGEDPSRTSRGPEEAEEPQHPAIPDAIHLEPAAPQRPQAKRGRKPKSAAEPVQAVSAYADLTSMDGYIPILVSMTTRLSPATAEALRRAALELRLKRRKLHTQQEIVEAAVRHWLNANGFGQAG
jgi:hypothetical protein